MSTVIELSEIMTDLVSKSENCVGPLKPGTYYLKDFFVIDNPQTLKRTAYLVTKGGKYWTTSTPIIRGLDNEVGQRMAKALKEVDLIKITVVPYRSTNNGKMFGVTFYLAQEQEDQRPEKPAMKPLLSETTDIPRFEAN